MSFDKGKENNFQAFVCASIDGRFKEGGYCFAAEQSLYTVNMYWSH